MLGSNSLRGGKRNFGSDVLVNNWFERRLDDSDPHSKGVSPGRPEINFPSEPRRASRWDTVHRLSYDVGDYRTHDYVVDVTTPECYPSNWISTYRSAYRPPSDYAPPESLSSEPVSESVEREEEEEPVPKEIQTGRLDIVLTGPEAGTRLPQPPKRNVFLGDELPFSIAPEIYDPRIGHHATY